MSADIEPKLLAFLAGAFARHHEETCVKIELEFSPGSGYSPDRLQTWTPQSHPEYFGVFAPEDSPEGEDVGKLAQKRHVFTSRLVGEMVQLARDFADSHSSGTHRFTVRTHQHLGGRDTHRFVLKPSYRGEDGDDAAPLEATTSGQIAQLMRHLENKERGMRDMMGSFLQAISRATESTREENQALRSQVNDLLAWRQKTIETIEEARSKEHDRELDLLIRMGEKERKDFAVKKVVNLLPVAMSAAMRRLGSGQGGNEPGKVNGTANKKAAPASPLAQALGKLALTITDEQKAQMQVVLSLEQIVSLQEAIESALEGGSLMLPTITADLISSLKPSQLSALMGSFTEPQQLLLVQVMQLAKAAQAQQEASDAPGGKSDDGDKQVQPEA
jgi:hypothetical protein